MRSRLAPILLMLGSALAVTACSYYYSITERAAGPTILVDSAVPTQSYHVRACISGPYADELSIEIKPWSSYPDAAMVTASVGEFTETLGPRDADTRILLELSDFENFEEACEVGAIVTFELDPAAMGEVMIEWDVEVQASTDVNEELEAEYIEIEIGPES